MNDWKFNINSISKKDLPLSVEVNGVTYYSSMEITNDALTWSNAQHGPEYMKGYEDGKKEIEKPYKSIINDALKYGDGYVAYQDGYFAGKKKGYDEGYEQGECDGFGKGYGRGFSEGYDIGMKEAKKESQPNDHFYNDEQLDELKKEWYEQGFANGKVEGNDQGYKEGFSFGKIFNSKDYTDNSDVVVESNEKLKEDKNKLCNDTKCNADKEEAYKEGFAEGRKHGYNEQSQEATIEKVAEFNKGYEIGSHAAVSKEEEYELGWIKGYAGGYNDGYEQCEHDGIHKINYNTEPIAQTKPSEEYDNGFIKGKEEGWNQGYKEGHGDGTAMIKLFAKIDKEFEKFVENEKPQIHPDKVILTNPRMVSDNGGDDKKGFVDRLIKHITDK